MTDRPEAMLIRTLSFIPSHSFFLSPCLCTPPSLPLTIAGAARSLLHSVAFSLSLAHPSLACSLPLSLSSSFLSCFLPPSSLLQSSLPRSLFEPSGRRSAQCQERKRKGREEGKKGGVGDRNWMEELQKHAGLQRWADGQNESQKVALKISPVSAAPTENGLCCCIFRKHKLIILHTRISNPRSLTLTLTHVNWLHQIRRGKNTDTCLSIRNVTALPHCTHQRS